MTQVGAATPTTTNLAATGEKGANELGKDDFVKLLMAQLGNQDPTTPVDSEAFVAQLAQFASVELLQKMNTGLEAIVMAEAASNQSAAIDLVGKNISFESDAVTLGDTVPVPLAARVDGPASEVTVAIQDENGKTVRTLHLGATEGGPVAGSWDGLDDAGEPLPPGEYHVTVTATTVDGTAVDATPVHEGHVDGITFTSGVPELLVDGRRLKLSEILEVRSA